MAVIAVDMGGTFLRLAVADDTGQMHRYARLRMPKSQSHFDGSQIWEFVLDSIARYVADVERRMQTVHAVSMAVPGPVTDGRRLVAAPTITGHEPIPDLAGALEARTGRPVHLVNDVSAAAWHLGEYLDFDRFFIVTVSSGIGGKMFDRRHALRVLDNEPYAGEIGHLVVDTKPGAAPCDCGGRGHLGAISSGRGTERLAQRLASREDAHFRGSAVARMLNDSRVPITNEEHLIPAALNGDLWSLSVIDRAAQPLAQLLSALIASVGVDRIVVIGGFAQRLGAVYKDMLSGLISKHLSARAFSRFGGNRIVVCDDGQEICLAGAVAFYRARYNVQ